MTPSRARSGSASPCTASEVGQVLDRSGGQIVSLSEAELERAWRSLAHEEGIFCEPASAAGIAARRGDRVARRAGRLRGHRPRPQGHRCGLSRRSGSEPRRRRRTSAPASTAPAPLSTSGTSSSSLPGDEPPRPHASGRACLRAPRPRRRLELSLHRPDSPGTRARLQRLGGGARAGRGGDRRQAGADGRRAARTRDRARGSRRQPRRGAHGRRLPDVGNAHRPDRGHRAGDADRGRSGAPGRDRRRRGPRFPTPSPTPTPPSPRDTPRCSAPRSASNSRRPLRGSPGRSAARALPRRRAPRSSPRFAPGHPPAHSVPPCPAPARRSIVWARNGKTDSCADELRQRFPNEQVLPLTISPTGAGPT